MKKFLIFIPYLFIISCSLVLQPLEKGSMTYSRSLYDGNLYEVDFSDPSSENFQITNNPAASFSIYNGYARAMSGSGEVFAIDRNSPELEDGIFQFKMRPSDYGRCGAIIRYSSNSDYTWIGYESTGHWRIREVINGQSAGDIYFYKGKLSSYTWYTVRIIFEGKKIRILSDGDTVYSGYLNNPREVVSGQIGFVGWSLTDTLYDDIKLSDSVNDADFSGLYYNDWGNSLMNDLIKNRGESFSDYNYLAANWFTPEIPDKITSDYLFEVQFQGNAGRPELYQKDVIERSIDYHQVGTLEAIDKGFIPIEPQYEGLNSRAHEWGYSRFNLHGVTDGSGRQITDPHYLQIPGSRNQAISWLWDFLEYNYVGTGSPRPWFSMNGHYPYHHYAGEFGFDILGSEIGENINNYQMLLAFNRGAARVFDKPWFVDVSAWFSGGITDYSSAKIWGSASGSDRGHSLSLYKRTYYMSYMAGAGAIAAEAGGINFFYDTDPLQIGGESVLRLSPLGEIGKDFSDFTRNHPDPGVPYTPFAVFLDREHGTYIGNGALKRAFKTFLYNSGDKMSWWLFHMLYPGGWDITANGENETGTMVGSYHGDLYDVVLQNTRLDKLSTYPALIMSGDIVLQSPEAENLRQYVEGGGILVMNSAYAGQLPWATGGNEVSPLSFLAKKYGAGMVLQYGPDYGVGDELSNILFYLDEGLTPFAINCDNGREIEFQINRKADSWVVTLINNAGVTKTSDAPAVVHPEQVITATVTSRRGPVVSYDNWLGGFSRISDESLEVTIEPGGIAIVEIGL